MALVISKGDNAALQVFFKGMDQNGIRRYELGMGGFARAKNATATTALGTCGAGPCQIIVVHKEPGLGALGHYPGDARTEKVVKGIDDMIQAVGGLPVANVVLAAGSVGETKEERADYKKAILEGVSGLCGNATVDWPDPPKDDVWGACYYLPKEEKVGLLMNAPGNFVGTGNSEFGITLHNFSFEK
jgi:hypothetical protein